ncbi:MULTISPECIES: AI-2E family transporter [unclassified Modestobacter]|uniref:AI-2E family transporter n=1 Tax=unclassified Modestobacter TaxID=2643866 RepID=UPI0022AAA0EC|nr:MULTISPECIES: AI-2E family transporter [unclassified Modestobacter]MCZ2814051.1 AI-2E family transporter [Modestobacter sp. VKM Ac-2979]MCZ2844533.1 AI-2E family transporter [Modestobacter sp. VKM Ac-2980]MCZ2848923.1 AI-2E family transporter [Modestobacter sp. VKM Ac-2978]
MPDEHRTANAAEPAADERGEDTGASRADTDTETGTGTGTDEHEIATTRAPIPGPERARRLQAASRRVAVASAELILIVIALLILGRVIGELWVVLLPVVLGLLFTTVLWPVTRFLRHHGWPPALASLLVLLLFLGAFGGIIAVIAPQVVGQVEEVADGVTQGLEQVQDYLAGPPFNIDDQQVGNAVDSIIDSVQSNAQNIAGYAVTTATTIGGLLINLVLALVLTFFFLKDGPKWVPWLAAQTGPQAAPHVAALSLKTWRTLSEFIRQQAIVGFVDALFIGIGLLVLGVPLVVPLAVLTFFGAFIPIIGAFVAGGFAVLIALVDSGLTTALIVLGLIIVVQQIEGNVLQPILQGRGLNLHAAVVILAVTAGASLAGIIGAFLAVPVAALLAVAYRYGRDVLDGNNPEIADDGTREQLVRDASGTHLVREPADTTPGS